MGFNLAGRGEEMVNLTLFKLPRSQKLGVDSEFRAGGDVLSFEKEIRDDSPGGRCGEKADLGSSMELFAEEVEQLSPGDCKRSRIDVDAVGTERMGV